MSEFEIPQGGLVEAPVVAQPNIFPIEWRCETPKLAEIYERAKREGFNPADIDWSELSPEAWSDDEKVAIMYWWALLSNFDSSGPAVFARATIHAWEMHEEDPVRKCFFSITRDETNHEETCQRVIQRLVPNGPQGFTPKSELQRVALNNIGWLYHNGGRYWTGYNRAIDRYPLAVIFTSFMMGEVASSTLFHGMAHATTHPVFRDIFTKIGRDEARHLADLHQPAREGVARTHRRAQERSSPSSFARASCSSRWCSGSHRRSSGICPATFCTTSESCCGTAREAGLGILTYEQQADNWRLAIARVRKLVERWDIQFPAIPELDIEGVDVGDITAEDIIPVF